MALNKPTLEEILSNPDAQEALKYGMADQVLTK